MSTPSDQQTTNFSGDNNSLYYDYYGPSEDLNFLHDTFIGNIQRQSAIFGIVLTIWTFITNTAIICACLAYRTTRGYAYYIQIINFCLVNVVISTFVIPLTIYYILQPWNLGGAMCKIWVIFDVLLPCLSMLILVLLNVDRLMLMKSPTTYSCVFQKCLTQVVLVAPWLVSAVIVVPLWTHGTIPYENEPGQCIVAMSVEAALACPVLTYFIPLVIIIVLTLRILVLRVRHHHSWELTTFETEAHRSNAKNGYIRSDTDDCLAEVQTASTDSIVSLCLVNFFFAAMWFPFQCMSLLLSLCTPQVCVPSLLLNQALTWMGTASAGFPPLFWLVDETIRGNILNMLRCRCPRVFRGKSSDREETYV